MPLSIGDDEPRSARPATPMRPPGSGGAPVAAALPLLANALGHCLRRVAWHLPARRSERDPCYYSDRLLARDFSIRQTKISYTRPSASRYNWPPSFQGGPEGPPLQPMTDRS